MHLEEIRSSPFPLYAATSFDEVVLMDADSFPLMAPEAMFELEPYRSHGNLFFPDYCESPVLCCAALRCAASGSGSGGGSGSGSGGGSGPSLW